MHPPLPARAPRHLPLLPPTAAWDKGWHWPRAWLGPGPPLPQLCSHQGPSWAGPGQYPSAGARVELCRVGASAEQGPHTRPSPVQAAGAWPCPMGLSLSSSPVPVQPRCCCHPHVHVLASRAPQCCQLEIQHGGTWIFVVVFFFFLQDSIFFKFIVRLLFRINFNKLMLVPLWQGCVTPSVPEGNDAGRGLLLPPLQQAGPGVTSLNPRVSCSSLTH